MTDANQPPAVAQNVAPSNPAPQPEQGTIQKMTSVKKLEPPQLVRSHLLLNSDRFGMENKYMTHLKSGDGLLGMGLVSLEQEKRQVC